MTTLYFWCTHKLYSKNKLLHSTVKSHLSLIHNRHHLVNTKCILNTVSRVSRYQNNFFSPNSIITFQTWTSCCFSTNILIAACNLSILLKCTMWYLLFVIYITVDPKERPQQPAEEAGTHTEQQRPCTSHGGTWPGGTYYLRSRPIRSIYLWCIIHSCPRHLLNYNTSNKKSQQTISLRRTKTLQDVFLCRKHLGFMIGSLFIFEKSKGDLHFAKKCWLTRVFSKQLKTGFVPVSNQFNSWSQKLLQPHIPPHAQQPLGRAPSLTVLPSPGGDASAGTTWLPPTTVQESWITPCRPICQHKQLEKNVSWEVSGAGEPLFGTNPVKTTVPELRRSAAGRQRVLLQQEHTFHLVMFFLPHIMHSPVVVTLTCDCLEGKACLFLFILSASAVCLSRESECSFCR